MAVVDGLPGVEVTVKVGGRKAVEYDDPDAADAVDTLPNPACKTTSKYIESVDNAEFALLLNISHSYDWGYRDHSLSVHLFVDGQQVRQNVL